MLRQWGTVAILATLALGGCGEGRTTPEQLRAELRTCQSDTSGTERAACFQPVVHAAEDRCSARSQSVVVAPDLTVTCASPQKGKERVEAKAKAVLAAVPHHCWSAREETILNGCHGTAIGTAIAQLEQLMRANCPVGDVPFVNAERAVAGCLPRVLIERSAP